MVFVSVIYRARDVCDYRTSHIIAISLLYSACTYAHIPVYINPPGMVKIVYIICVYYRYTGYGYIIILYYIHVKRGRQTLRLNGFLLVNFKHHYIKFESENQKSGLIILLVLFHSAYPYKIYCLKCFTALQTYQYYLFI